ncbi:MAG: TatD family nuclease-associated radical SAM protein [Elusimicrobiales bacterium]|nr:TatD family nuclease-associated radical SAM protein [Elusimicrobiales bacterium]
MRKNAETVYRYHGALYVNLTNRCPNACVFCIKSKWGMKFRGHDLHLAAGEPSPEAVLARIAELDAKEPASEIVFCGYGEPTMRLDELISVARGLKKPGRKVRLNTVGLGSLVWKRDVPAALKGLVDSVCISLNSPDPAQWRELVRPDREYEKQGYQAVLEFIRSCVENIPETAVTVVDLPQVDKAAARKLAASLGAQLRVRPYLAEYEQE